MTAPRDPVTSGFVSASPDANPLEMPTAMAGSAGGAFPFLEPPQADGELGRLNNLQYRVTRLLGAGGMGYVFEAEDTHLHRAVALKVMKPELAADAGFRDRFLGEARAAAKLISDYVVTVYQVGMAHDVPFLAMQLLHGESLQERLQRTGPLNVPVAIQIAHQAAEGLAAAHAVGLVHRDIKPANLWLETDPLSGAFRRVKLLDFGLARAYDKDSKLTATGVIVGTPHYMAPEQANGFPIDGRADLFSLGCVMYTMLTGEMAFDGPTTMAVLMALANHVPPALSSRNPNIPPAVSDLVARLMSKDPNLRPANAQTVIAALDDVIAMMPPIGTPPRLTGGLGMAALYRAKPAATPAPKAVATGVPTLTKGVPTLGPASVNTPVTPVTTKSLRPNWPLPSSEESATPPVTPLPASPPTGSRRGVWMAIGLALAIAAGTAGWKFFGGRLSSSSTDHGLVVAPLQSASDTRPTGPPTGEPILLGVLHSTSGTMAVSESPVVDATLLAIDTINTAGGVLGRPLKAVVVDGKSDPTEFEKGAERLITADKVVAIFGCWTSASRKDVREVVQRHNGALFYPVQYEGLEVSPRIVYLGPTANQQLMPALDYLINDLKKRRLFLLGSDYVFPRAAAELIKDDISKNRRSTQTMIVGETFLPLGEQDVSKAIDAIKKAKPDVIMNLVNGSTNFALFPALRKSGSPVNEIPVMSVSLMETDLRRMEPKDIAGHFLTGTYFQAIDSAQGRELLQKVKARYGSERVLSDPMIAAYAGVHLWAKAALLAKSVEPTDVLKTIRGQTYHGPSGTIKIDPDNLHTWLQMRIGKVRSMGEVVVTTGSGDQICPVPYPETRSRPDWERFLNGLYIGWGNNWQAPAAKP